ncbi:MAG: XisI protein [Desulfobacteraceae bacterium]|nr:XisI protein [Desulfobacteraceae bacterium]
MAGSDKYRNIIKQLLSDYARIPPSNGNIEMETIFDESYDRYQLVAMGWQGKKRVYGCVIHIDLKENKVWLQHDSTDTEIAKTLTDMGIPANHIVLGFQPEHYRQYSGFAVN